MVTQGNNNPKEKTAKTRLLSARWPHTDISLEWWNNEMIIARAGPYLFSELIITTYFTGMTKDRDTNPRRWWWWWWWWWLWWRNDNDNTNDNHNENDNHNNNGGNGDEDDDHYDHQNEEVVRQMGDQVLRPTTWLTYEMMLELSWGGRGGRLTEPSPLPHKHFVQLKRIHVFFCCCFKPQTGQWPPKKPPKSQTPKNTCIGW